MVTAATAETVTYTFPADTALQPFYRWTAPAGVCLARFDLYGAEGATTTSGGAHVTSTLAVKSGSSYDVYIGGQGYLGQGGYNGGGAAVGSGVGGGGATDVRDGPALTDRLLVAGGGGGSGGYGGQIERGIGGVGGLVGTDGTTSPLGYYSGLGGKGGTATAGGEPGAGGPPAPGYGGKAGALGVGGAGGVAPGGVNGSEGGGGGGGLFGGGGGASSASGYAGGGGGGGSSLTAGGTVDGQPHFGNGRAEITFEPSPACNAGGGNAGGGAPNITLPLPTGTNPKAGVARVGTRLTLTGRFAAVKLQCTLVETCRGRLSLTATGLPRAGKASAAQRKATKLGAARFAIPALKTKTVKVKLARTIRRRLAALSARRLKRLKVVATAKVGGTTTKFSLGATRKR